MFDPNIKFPNNQSITLSDHNRQLTGRDKNILANYTINNQSWNKEDDPFRACPRTMDDGDSDASTPTLWSNSNSPEHTSPQYRQQTNLCYRNLSPKSRTQAIARGQRELMEMASRMSEGCYELSLKDIVEYQTKLEAKQDTPILNREDTVMTSRKSLKEGVKTKENMKKNKKSDKKAVMNQSGSFDNGGFLLKTVFPIPFGSRMTKRSSSRGSNSAIPIDGRVSPRPLLGERSLSNKGVDSSKWSKKGLEESLEEGSESVGFSSNSRSSKSSGSNSSRSSSRSSSRIEGIGCWSWILNKGRAQSRRPC